jgi:hypothetical protein
MIVNPRASSGNVSLNSRTMRKEKECTYTQLALMPHIPDLTWSICVAWEVAAPAQEPTKDAAMEGPLTILSNVVKSWYVSAVGGQSAACALT